MNFDIRSGEYLFKHATDEVGEIDIAHHIPHSHNSFELYYFISGEGEYYVGDVGYRLYPGSILLIRPGVEHHLLIKDNEPYERIVIRFPEDDLSDVILEELRKKENFYFVRNSEVGKEILHLDTHFLNISDDMVLSSFKISLYLILIYIINFQPEKSGANAENERITRIVEYIDNHLTDIESLDYLCKGLHISKSALSKLFSEEMGVPIMTRNAWSQTPSSRVAYPPQKPMPKQASATIPHSTEYTPKFIATRHRILRKTNDALCHCTCVILVLLYISV